MASLVVPWGSGGWKGMQVAHSASPGFEAPSFDDSAWAETTLPLGDYGAEDPATSCPILSTHPANTTWNINTDFLLRRTIPGARDFTFTYAIDNQAWIYIDGVLIDYGENSEPGNEFCAARDDHAPVSGLLSGGAHVLAIRCRDVGGVSYFDMEIQTSTVGGWTVGAVAIG